MLAKSVVIESQVSQTGLPLSFLSWAYILKGVYFGAYGKLGVSIFGIFICQAFRFSAYFRPRPTQNNEDVGLHYIFETVRRTLHHTWTDAFL